MAFDTILLLLIIILIIFILFRKELLSLFKGKSKLKRRDRGSKETKRTPQEQKLRTEDRIQKPIPKQKPSKTEERQKERDNREKERRETNAKAAAEQKAAKEALAKKEAEKKAAAERIAAEKAAKKPEEVRKELPKGDYSDFNNSRLLDMGLSQADADSFVLELIGQIDNHIPQLEAAIEAGDHEKVEHLTHSVKGSATNLGTGGVADVITDFNAYCKDGTDEEVLLAHLNNLKSYQEKLKSQFS